MSDKIFLLWDESHFWGIMLLRALRAWDIPLEIISARRIAEGLLQRRPPKILFVPGGWSRLKAEALGEQGRLNIRRYVREGGVYIGFCGGAGLALDSEHEEHTLALCPCKRKPMHRRLPNFSGYVNCKLNLKDRAREIILPVWWPSQFTLPRDPNVETLCTYFSPADDFWVSDLKIEDLPQSQLKKWEETYGINLDPLMIKDEPCILRGSLGEGTYWLSYTHLETPLSGQANSLLGYLLELYAVPSSGEKGTVPAWDILNPRPVWEAPELLRAHKEISRLVNTGREHFLLISRYPWLLGWRRGIPGSALNFLLAMLARILETPPTPEAEKYLQEHRRDIGFLHTSFISGMREYLLCERLVLARSPSSPEASGDQELQEEKQRLVGKFPGYGGLYGELLQHLEAILWRLIRDK